MLRRKNRHKLAQKETPVSSCLTGASATGELGFEPRLTDPESVYLLILTDRLNDIFFDIRRIFLVIPTLLVYSALRSDRCCLTVSVAQA